MGNWYNGYSWQQREALLKEKRRLQRANDTERLSYLANAHPCEICLEPAQKQFHSEDYSTPYLLRPPATFAVCRVCHSRLHKRFDAPLDWQLYVQHVKKGGYGREYTALHNQATRKHWISQLSAGVTPTLPDIRPRPLDGQEWWQHLSLDKKTLHASWARPRPLRPRPSTEAYRMALAKLSINEQERALLTTHARAPRRSLTMRQLAQQALGNESARSANLIYGRLAHRLAKQANWQPDLREDGSPIWMTAVAEGWQPESGEFEWVMVPALAEHLH